MLRAGLIAQESFDFGFQLEGVKVLDLHDRHHVFVAILVQSLHVIISKRRTVNGHGGVCRRR